jgi:hypothetical protein
LERRKDEEEQEGRKGTLPIFLSTIYFDGVEILFAGGMHGEGHIQKFGHRPIYQRREAFVLDENA